MAGKPQVDYPAGATPLSVLRLGRDEVLTSRVRRETGEHLCITPPRTGTGERVRFLAQDLLELSWQADDGFRTVSAVALALTDDDTWRLRVTGPASRIQRRDAVRAPIGLSASVAWDDTVLSGCTVDLSEGGLLCVFRPLGDLGSPVLFPSKGQRLKLTLNLHSDLLVTEVRLVRRHPGQDNRQVWSLQYLDLPEQSADLIRSRVFTALRSARARELATLY